METQGPAPFVFEKRAWLDTWDFPSQDDAILLLERDVSWFKPLYFNFEREYDGIPVLLFSRRHYWLGPLFAFMYLLFIWFGPKYMANRKAFDLRGPLKYWNLALAIYSFWGASRVVPHIFVFLWRYGWHATLCSPPVFTYGRGAVGFWTMTFIYSKFFELVDTIFIVLRKRKLNFLHWYHHVTVLMYTWDAFVTEQPPGLYYCGMNYFVHAVMYFYYYLAAAMDKPPKWGMIVTILQIAQMVAGVAITITSLYNSFTYPFMFRSTAAIARDPKSYGECYISRSNMISACAMYSTYFYLFAVFFISRYVNKPKKDAAKSSRKLASPDDPAGCAKEE
eukprot:Gregarina_sp_Pseudo_9__5894@NODE_92_length_4347_cov_50_466806_g84_i0_p2_GENE_NODE_92_length_4347_cov_50_466806_g84_i0NODE_92_length_4347_cov_50_466806_g84_i0_p2_ORF_typecomplete_len335_score44_92ELO/PF01151_18/3_6e65_NODE_92_length_4347_cov_50_466806_g84_i032074211